MFLQLELPALGREDAPAPPSLLVGASPPGGRSSSPPSTGSVAGFSGSGPRKRAFGRRHNRGVRSAADKTVIAGFLGRDEAGQTGGTPSKREAYRDWQKKGARWRKAKKAHHGQRVAWLAYRNATAAWLRAGVR